MPNVTIIGAGFAALSVVRTSWKLGPDAQISLVAPGPEWVYRPGLMWIP